MFIKLNGVVVNGPVGHVDVAAAHVKGTLTFTVPLAEVLQPRVHHKGNHENQICRGGPLELLHEFFLHINKQV